jgi:hypothetical protein
VAGWPSFGRLVQVAPRNRKLARNSKLLLRTFTAQTEALAKIKRGGEQTVRVEDVHVYSGGQAIVGSVSNRKVEGGGVDEKENQAYGTLDPRAIAAAPGAALLGPNTVGDSLSETRGERQEALPPPRRREGSGAPCGERNGSYRHGLYTREAIAERKAMRALIRSFREDARAALSALDATSGARPTRGGS